MEVLSKWYYCILLCDCILNNTVLYIVASSKEASVLKNLSIKLKKKKNTAAAILPVAEHGSQGLYDSTSISNHFSNQETGNSRTFYGFKSIAASVL